MCMATEMVLKNNDYRLGVGGILGLGHLGGTFGSNSGFTGNHVQIANRGCLVGQRKYQGTCKGYDHCDIAKSDELAGIEPTKCSSRICCRTEPRISEIMCDKYKEFFTLSGGYLCRFPAPTPRIIGGRDALPTEFPNMVGVAWRWEEKADVRCGGTLISDEYVLTAAHCYEASVAPAYIVLGDVLQDPDSTEKTRLLVKIKRFIKHPEYKSDITKKFNDIALIQLERKVNFSSSIRPACLPNSKLRQELKMEFTALGWGFNETAHLPDNLQALQLERRSIEGCKREPSIICAGSKARDTCNGDSGGPLTVSNDRLKCIFHVLGVTNSGSSPCGSGKPGLYANVQSNLDWIEETVWPVV